jgi:hypothetical protein
MYTKGKYKVEKEAAPEFKPIKEEEFGSAATSKVL